MEAIGSRGVRMTECNYPKCQECNHPDCNMDEKDIAALLKRRRYANNPEKYRLKQQQYRSKVKATLPHCDECEMCVLVKKEKSEGFRRLCVSEMQLIEQKVSNCPTWCKKRKGEKTNGVKG